MGLTYKRAGVDIDKGNRLVDIIKRFAPQIGFFSGMFPLKLNQYRKPVIVAATDGVGTKLKIAQMVSRHDTVGIDLVAMCVNDVITCGADPLFFLDYFACGRLDIKIASEVIREINKGCQIGNCVLLGGETAEMPGFYKGNEYDLAGFCVGLIDRKRVIDGSGVRPGDIIWGIPSSGLHSNGYSLVRKIFSSKSLKKDHRIFLKPTRIYVKEIKTLLKHLKNGVLGLAHITGGGLRDNVVRILPKGCRAEIDSSLWHCPRIFLQIKKRGNISRDVMFRTFNMGIGMVFVTRAGLEKGIRKYVRDAMPIGHIGKGKRGVLIV